MVYNNIIKGGIVMKIKTKDMILVSLFAALTAVGGIISLPIGTVPVTLQTFFTLLSGLLLGPFLGALSQILYLIIGLIGIPIFAGGTGGLATIFSPAFGYIIGFIVASFVIGSLLRSKAEAGFFRILAACIIGTIAVYIVGIPYMFIILKHVSKVNITLVKTLQIGFLVFIPGDLIKCLVAAVIGSRLNFIIKKFY